MAKQYYSVLKSKKSGEYHVFQSTKIINDCIITSNRSVCNHHVQESDCDIIKKCVEKSEIKSLLAEYEDHSENVCANCVGYFFANDA